MLLVFNRIHTRTMALVLALWLVAPAAGHADRHAVTTARDGAPSIAIDNFGRVSATYYRGAEPHEADFASLVGLGIRTLVDLTGDDGDSREQARVEKAGMKYVHIPMSTRQTPSAEQVAEFLRVVDDPASQPVYVHCVGGRHRTGVMTAVYRMAREGWTADQAFREMKAYRFGADFLHPEFKRFIYSYQPAGLASAN